MPDILDRKVPFSIEAEQAVLGSILIDPEGFSTVAEILHSEDFYLSEHEAIYTAMSDMFSRSKSIDTVTLIETLVQNGNYENADKVNNYLRNIVASVPTAANIGDYAKIVHDKALLRSLISACSEITDTAYMQGDTVTNILNEAEAKVFNIASGNEVKGFRRISEVLQSVLGELQSLQTDPESHRGTPTGFSDLDHVLVGFNKGDMVLIGARPGMGKTSFAMNIAVSAARRTGKKVAVFSLEMSCEQIVTRMLSSEAMVDSYNLRSGNLSGEDWEKLASAAGQLAECDIVIDDTTGIRVTGMKAKLRREKNLGMVVIDYLQLMQSDRRIDNRVQEVSDISRNLKLMAKELGIPVICCAQLSRAPEQRTGNKPQLSDLRDSGAIEQDADIVMFLYRPDYYTTTNGDDKKNENVEVSNIAEVIIAKNRHGSTGNVELYWNGRYTKFASKADPTQTPPGV